MAENNKPAPPAPAKPVPGATNKPVSDKPAAGGTRPSVLSLAIKERSALYAAYMPFLKNGGIFVPTTRPYKIGEEIFLILDLIDDNNKYPIAGKVAWVTPSGPTNNKTQGVGIHFPADDSGMRARQAIEKFLGSALHSNRTTHTV